jgi:regulator of microtubule dynamics protein 3
MRRSSWVLFLLSGFLTAGPVFAPISAQVSTRVVEPGAAEVAVQADSLYAARRAAESLTGLDAALAEDASSFDLLWRASRAAFALGVLEAIPEVRDGFYDRAIAYAERAAELRPDRVEGHYWLAASLGRRALSSGVRQRTALAGRILTSAERVLDIDSLHAGAHHVLGKLNFEVMDLSGVARWVARSFMGNPALENSSWKKARSHLERAVELDGSVVIYRLDLARYYENRGEGSLAREQIARLLSFPLREPFDSLSFEEARVLRDKLGG